MSIHSVPTSSDPRVVCGLLAKEVLATIDRRDDDDESAFINFVRLLDVYRHDAFRGRKPRGVLERSARGPRRAPQKPDTLPRVKAALAAAHEEVFGAASKADVAAFVIRVLEQCYKQGSPQPDRTELRTTKRFIETLIENLDKP